MLAQPAEPTHLLIFGASTRAAAFSALRAGFQPWCADLFADADLQARCPVVRVPGGCYPERFADIVRTDLEGPWMYTGGLENRPALIEAMCMERQLWGVGEPELTKVRDPWRRSCILRWHGVPAPRVWWSSWRRTPRSGRWLSKPLDGSGGVGIRFWQPGGPRPGARVRYLQEYIEGHPCSAIFVGMAGCEPLLGVTRQLVGEPWLHAAPFRYCGSIGPLKLNESQEHAFRKIGDTLGRHFLLPGLFGIDCVLCDGVPYPVEVNPRYTASVEVLEYATGIAAMAWHARAFVSSDAPLDTAGACSLSPEYRGEGLGAQPPTSRTGQAGRQGHPVRAAPAAISLGWPLAGNIATAG